MSTKQSKDQTEHNVNVTTMAVCELFPSVAREPGHEMNQTVQTSNKHPNFAYMIVASPQKNYFWNIVWSKYSNIIGS